MEMVSHFIPSLCLILSQTAGEFCTDIGTPTLRVNRPEVWGGICGYQRTFQELMCVLLLPITFVLIHSVTEICQVDAKAGV